ncbi:MAG: hypothetical protein JO251_03410 [Verrucomicrobia bacterium]|nr:hypothetical protein [Verrucomicrobiota bacterium]
MLTSPLSRLLTLTLLLFGASSMFADICEDYARVIDTHIAKLRVVEKSANAVSDSKQAVEVINQYVDEMISWRRQMAPLDRAVFEMDQGNVENAPPLCQKAIERFNFFAKEDLDLAEKLGDLLVKYISDPAVVSAWRRMQDLPHR